MPSDISVQFHRSGRGAAREPSDPAYPKGITVRMVDGPGDTCSAALPYPAPECGMFVLNCSRCGWNGVVTAAGRKDDPRLVTMSCKQRLN